jgi:hypothetical protein
LGVAGGVKEDLQPGAAQVGPAHRGTGDDFDGAGVGGNVAGLVALEGTAGEANLLAEVVFDGGGGGALIGSDGVDRALEQAAKGFVAGRHCRILSRRVGSYNEYSAPIRGRFGVGCGKFGIDVAFTA